MAKRLTNPERELLKDVLSALKIHDTKGINLSAFVREAPAGVRRSIDRMIAVEKVLNKRYATAYAKLLGEVDKAIPIPQKDGGA